MNTGHQLRRIRLALAQTNVMVGDLGGNIERILCTMRQAADAQATVIAFPELALTGYPPEDLLLKPSFVSDNLRALEDLAQASAAYPNLSVVVGFVDRDTDLYNAAAILHQGKRVAVYHKHYLPNYGVFDEDRYFSSGSQAPIFEIGGALFGVNICEDIWYPGGPPTKQAYAGAEVLLNISASPFFAGKQYARERMLSTRAADSGAIVAYVNLVGGQDELIFDGSSVVFDEQGELLGRAKSFAEDLLVVDVNIDEVFRTRLHDPRWRKERRSVQPPDAEPVIFVSGPAPDLPLPTVAEAPPTSSQSRFIPTGRIEPYPNYLEEVYSALVLGVGDYVRKNHFQDAVIALSGGIDSALTATIAVDALGKEHVLGVSMPSRYSSAGSIDDARALADNLGIHCLSLSIEETFAVVQTTLKPSFELGPPSDSTLAEENIQARIRGMLLMGLSNRFGSIVLTTGNKSEMAVGYATLYGDMAGGFAVLKDVFKTLVYELARWRNAQAGYALIPLSTLEKPPSAELRPEQRDTDSLPPYHILDPILRAYVEEDRDLVEIVALGYDPDVVKRVMGLVDKSEYKRRQAPPGIKITERAFGRDRRLPVTNAYRGEPMPYIPHGAS